MIKNSQKAIHCSGYESIHSIIHLNIGNRHLKNNLKGEVFIKLPKVKTQPTYSVCPRFRVNLEGIRFNYLNKTRKK